MRSSLPRPGGGIGRHAGFRIQWPRGRAGSSPAPGTINGKAFAVEPLICWHKVEAMKKLNYLRLSFLAAFCLYLFTGCPGKKKDPEAPQEPDEPSVEKTQDILPEGEPYTVPELGMQMTWIPAGNFLMGSPPSEPGHRLEEEDLHNVVISRGFWIGTYEVTQKEFTSILDGENPSTFKGPQLPVHKVSWQTAMEFCKALTEREKFAGRMPEHWHFILPTEAQWEYACRAGTTNVFHFGNDEEALEDYAWFSANSKTGEAGTSRPRNVGEKKPNQWGIHDMHGNMGEWCYDWYGKVYSPDGSVDPITEKASDFKVFRGGTYTDISERCRAAHRNRVSPDTENPWIGFRLALMRKYFE